MFSSSLSTLALIKAIGSSCSTQVGLRSQGTPMASAATNPTTEPLQIHASAISSIKGFAESNGVSPIPSTYYTLTEPYDEVADHLAASIPIIDFSLLTSYDPQVHAVAVQELGKACSEWGFFMVMNHGISEKLMEDVMNKSKEFHELPLEEKKEFADDDPFAPIRHGTSFYPKAEKVHYWRDFLKVITLPQFNFPCKPPGFKKVGLEYSRKVRAVARSLLQGVSESLGLEANAIVESTGFDYGLQLYVANYYPPCPQPDLALGLPSHSDHGLLTLLTQNGVAGLQIKHHGKWVNVNPLPKCLLVNTGDQLEVVSNGRYRSVLHRAILNSRDTRISVAMANGPDLDKETEPAPELLNREKPLFKSIKYRDYFHLQQGTKLADKTRLDAIRLHPQ